MKRDKLHNIHSPGFKVPDDYFDTLAQKVQDKIQSQSLGVHTKQPGFITPEGYFDEVEKHIIQRVSEVPQPKVVQLNTKKLMMYFSGVAAALLLFLTTWPQSNNDMPITVEMVESHLAYSNLDTYELAELLIETDFLEIEDLQIEPKIDDDALEAYLLDHADLEQIILQ